MTRIISGRAKGMRLTTPKGDGTRPTTDRVREALFSALVTWFGAADLDSAEQFDGVSVLDLYAGTGAVGLEAASRGAGSVLLVDHRTAPVIRDNAAKAGLAVDVRAAKVDAILDGLTGPWDLVFVDPPYDVDGAAVDRVLDRLGRPGVMAPQGLVVVERSARTPGPTWPGVFTETWVRGYGETALHFGATDPSDEEGP